MVRVHRREEAPLLNAAPGARPPGMVTLPNQSMQTFDPSPILLSKMGAAANAPELKRWAAAQSSSSAYDLPSVGTPPTLPIVVPRKASSNPS